MEKIDRLLNALEHPQDFSFEELQNLLSDPETANLYRLLCRESSSKYDNEALSDEEVDRQWNLFRSSRLKKGFLGLRSKKGVAAAVIIISSFTLMGMGITLGLKMINQRNLPVADITTEAPAEIVADTSLPADSVQESIPSAIVFDNKSLHEILTTLAPHYGVKLRFDSNNARDIFLYYRWDESMTLDDVTEHLNTFSRINLKISNDTLIY